jgi:hypothetical protein
MAALVVGFTLTGCSGLVFESSGSGSELQKYEPADEQAPDSQQIPQPEANLRWSCSYDPTYNRDWHDDVVCNDGAESQRPYLLEDDSFVTEDEIRQAASEYEAQLNASR